MKRETICSQQVHCLNCPLSKSVTSKDCRELTQTEIRNIMLFFRELEAFPIEFSIKMLTEYLNKAEEAQRDIYNKALSRCKKVTGNDFPTYLDVIVFLSKEIDCYREKIKRLEGKI